MSEHLGAQGIPHLVLERHRVAERWRTERWDGLRANGPAWHDRFPGLEFTSGGPHHFPGRDDIVGYLEDYARQVNAPIRTGVEVRRVGRAPGRAGYAVETSRGAIHAGAVVAATGPFQVPLMPPVIDIDAPVVQMHSNAYRSPEALIPGGVLVVGAGSSGAQIADELNRAGRQVWLSVGPHERPPRRYRGRDFVWWLGVLGKWDAPTPGPSTRHVTIAVSGAEGGQTVDFRRMAARGITLVGMTESYAAGEVHFAPDLERNLAAGDQSLQGLLAEADAFVARRGLDLPAELEAHEIPPPPPRRDLPPRPPKQGGGRQKNGLVG
ncbi:MAG: NAD(P)/FAD-dependent oxidoreductase, partial [Pseudomonadota bacterium]